MNFDTLIKLSQECSRLEELATKGKVVVSEYSKAVQAYCDAHNAYFQRKITTAEYMNARQERFRRSL